MEGCRRTQKYDDETMKQCQSSTSYFCRWSCGKVGASNDKALGTSLENEL